MREKFAETICQLRLVEMGNAERDGVPAFGQICRAAAPGSGYRRMMKIGCAPLTLLAACTTLGPMPATTGISAVPAARPSVEAQIGSVPGYYFSSTALNQAYGDVIPQLSALIEPDRWLRLPGLIVGVRHFGEQHDAQFQPLIGYRTDVHGVGIAAVGYAATKRSNSEGANYHGFQAGAELAADVALLDKPWIGLHLAAAAAVTRVVASGSFCVVYGLLIDCDSDRFKHTMIYSQVSGFFPAATLTFAVDLAPGVLGPFRGARLAPMVAVGAMPLSKAGIQQTAQSYVSIGATLTLGFGAPAARHGSAGSSDRDGDTE